MKRGLGRGLTIVIIIFAVLLIAGGYLFFFQRDFVLGVIKPVPEAYFQVELYRQHGSAPIPDLEVRLWKENELQDKPLFKTAMTNQQGIAVFGKIPEGNYSIIFKEENYPVDLYYPGPIPVNLKKLATGEGETLEKPVRKTIWISILSLK